MLAAPENENVIQSPIITILYSVPLASVLMSCRVLTRNIFSSGVGGGGGG